MPRIYRVDLAKIEGEGDFPCPKCGSIISPDDESEESYTILDTAQGEDESLESIVIRCNKCGSTISLFSFIALLEPDSSRIEISEPLPESQPGYRMRYTVSLDGKKLGDLIVEVVQEGEVKAFKRLRSLHIGEPFRCTVNMTLEGASFKDEDLLEIARTVKRKFKGLKNGDVYIIEVKDGHKSLVGRY